MAALYADEDFPGQVVAALRAAGHDVVTARSDGRADQKLSDSSVLARAVSLGRAVLTNNRWHFIRLHRTDPQHFGIIACTEDRNYPALAARIHAAVAAVPSLAGQLIRIHRPNPPRTP